MAIKHNHEINCEAIVRITDVSPTCSDRSFTHGLGLLKTLILESFFVRFDEFEKFTCDRIRSTSKYVFSGDHYWLFC